MTTTRAKKAIGSENVASSMRKIIIEQSKRAGVGHIGSALSVVDILAVLYSGVINHPGAGDLQIKTVDLKTADWKNVERDRFVLSKGHAALALYAALHLRGFIDAAMLDTFCADGSRLGVHPELVCPGIDFATGSLGQGLSFAAGAALAARAQNSKRKVFVLISDAECNEGSLWESIMFCAQHRLSNLVVIVDLNGQQAFGYTKDVLDLSPMTKKWQAFGWNVKAVDGHDHGSLSDAFAEATGAASFSSSSSFSSCRPSVIMAQTVFGKGVSFMEHQIKWHYSPLSQDDYMQAVKELSQ